MYKDGKWAKEIISMQDDEGKWGWFHSLSQFSGSPLTTEQALRRLERLGYTIEDECIQKAVSYMNDCLTGKNTIPDRAEKVHDWNIFSSLILSTWIRRFTNDNPNANKIADKWAEVVSSSFAGGVFDHDNYVSAYRAVLKPNGGRIIEFDNFYHVSLLCDSFDKRTETAFVDHLLNNEKGIYYIYDSKISVPPENFESRNTSRYLASVELLAKYKQANYKLGFAVDWLNKNKNENGKWDMGSSVNDKVYFPLSDNWRKKETREADCTERIEKLINEIPVYFPKSDSRGRARETVKNKPQRYWIRDEIEEIIKTENIDRKRFHEVSKFEYEKMIGKFYYTFCDYEKYPSIRLEYLYLRFHERLKRSEIISCRDWTEYIRSIEKLTPENERMQSFFLILSQGWVYEGYLKEIMTVLNETDGLLDDFYIVSNHFDRVIVHSDDGDCMFGIYDEKF